MAQPVHKRLLTPFKGVGIDSAFARRALGRREARRLAELMAEAEQRARARLEAARLEAETIFAEARAEAEALLAMLPDFAALEAGQASALAAIRNVADSGGLPLAAVVGKQKHRYAFAARCEAVLAVAEACPGISEEEICGLFPGLSEKTVHYMLTRKRVRS